MCLFRHIQFGNSGELGDSSWILILPSEHICCFIHFILFLFFFWVVFLKGNPGGSFVVSVGYCWLAVIAKLQLVTLFEEEKVYLGGL